MLLRTSDEQKSSEQPTEIAQVCVPKSMSFTGWLFKPSLETDLFLFVDTILKSPFLLL